MIILYFAPDKTYTGSGTVLNYWEKETSAFGRGKIVFVGFDPIQMCQYVSESSTAGGIEMRLIKRFASTSAECE